MKTVTVQIGNSDDRLTQAQWSAFVSQVTEAVARNAHQIHFFGGSSNWTNWQNAAWIFECDESAIPSLQEALIAIRKTYNQDSVGYLEGETLFL